ncbi:MAG: hypothetical protein GX633_02220, partial [Clostridiales bacterium]|nr:hypothetical protein [Clostridiales bacterium]
MRTRKLICVFLAVLMFITVLPLHAMAAGNIVIKYPSGYTAEKITNPTRGEGEVDGLEAGGDRFNSYGWSMESLGDYIYIGTNRTILSILVYMTIESMGAYIVPGLSNEQIYDLFNTITHNHYPVIESVDEANPPEIIRINPETGETISLELPEGIKNSTLRDGAGFRSALKYGDRIYFGCEGNKTMYIVSVGEDSIVREEYSSGGDGQGWSLSLRASTVHNNEPYFGGTSTKIPSWQALSAEEQQGKRSLCVLKMTPGEGGNEA